MSGKMDRLCHSGRREKGIEKSTARESLYVASPPVIPAGPLDRLSHLGKREGEDVLVFFFAN